ncbi:DUF3019 domain-containing protein [Colwellia sp. UCD-KL20]|uniref:DUF3019 domain-containing protein n=1 Tax=Colwellia sp. UCD-KL20 TaxID=1917165 RepID=UPI0009705635|nr:DUF3019 domain-containing protein [Colwellia sp. UCD-KL20]
MYSKLSNGAAFPSIILIMCLLPKVSFAQQQPEQRVLFRVKPAMCVALNQGRTCYAQVNIQWSALLNNDFCIVQKKSTQPQQTIKCWKNSKGNSFSFEFESSESLTYQLINNNNEPLAEATVDVSWVHKKSPRKRRWRLF